MTLSPYSNWPLDTASVHPIVCGVYLPMAKRVLLETDKRLLWKFAYNFGWRGMRSVQRFKKGLKKGLKQRLEARTEARPSGLCFRPLHRALLQA